jgi:hypothetical protein
MAKATLTLTIKLSWWLVYLYLPGLRLVTWFCVNYIDMEMRPDREKLNKALKRGARFYLNGRRV